MDIETAQSGNHPVSAEIADWSREEPRGFWDPPRKLLLTIRRYQHWRHKGGAVGRLICKVLVLRHRFWSVITGADIPLNCRIGGGLLLIHPNGIVINPEAVIGVNCFILQQVTIGTLRGPGSPVIAGHVDIGAGAKVLGPIRIGAHAQVGANAVVLSDVPEGVTVVGIPARPVTPDVTHAPKAATN
jgi:serine O-acetyltransferase